MKRIKTIEIKNSPFFEDIKIDFSVKLNCIMGGRGTGKSTILHLLKSAVLANAENDKNTYSVLKSNLGNGEISLEIESEDGSFYRITKTFNDDPQPYKHPNSEYFPIDKIFNEIECDFYETGRIEEIGRSAKDRLRLLDKKIKVEIQEYELEIKQLQIDLDANAQDIKTFNLRLSRIDESLLLFDGIEAEFESQKQYQPIGLKDEEKKEFEEADSKEKTRKLEKRLLNKLIDAYSDFKLEFESMNIELAEIITKVQLEKDLTLNKEIMSEIINSTDSASKIIQANISNVSTEIASLLSVLRSSSIKLAETHDLQQAEFIKIKQKFEAHREYINKYHLLSKRLNEKETLIKDKIELSVKHNKLKQTRKQIVRKLNDSKQSIFKVRLNSINELNKTFDGAIVINLTFSGITETFEDKLREALKGSGMRYNEIIPRIVESFSTDEFASVIHEKDLDKLRAISGIDIGRS